MDNQISAQPGETIYSFLCRAIHEAKRKGIYLAAMHNCVMIFVQPNSCVEDLLDKWNMQRKIDKYEAAEDGSCFDEEHFMIGGE